MELEGRRVLLTGAAGGLGLPLCKQLVENGAEVIAFVKELDDAAELQSLGVSIHEVDLEHDELVQTVVKSELLDGGPVDILVNNAAIYPMAELLTLNTTEMSRVWQVNVKAATILAQACAKEMKTQRFGRILNIASITYDLGFKELSAYVATKAALIGLSRTWARELGAYNITSNSISPGAFPTAAEAIHDDPEGYNQFVLDQQSLKRRGTPEDFGNLVVFLASDKAGFITGQNIRVDGGYVTA